MALRVCLSFQTTIIKRHNHSIPEVHSNAFFVLLMYALAKRLLPRGLPRAASTITRYARASDTIISDASAENEEDGSKSKRQIRKAEKQQYYKKLKEMIKSDVAMHKSEDQLARLADDAFKDIMRLGKQNRLKDALQCYDETKHLQSPSRHYFTLCFLIGACQTAEHLPSAIRLFNEMSTNDYVPNEAAYVSLIRCFCDAGNERAAIEIIGKMFALGVDIKLRCCHPILQCLCRRGKPDEIRRAFDFIDYVVDKSVKVQSEQILVVIEGIFKGEGIKNPDIISRLHDLVEMCSEYIFGLPQEELRRIAATIRGVHTDIISAEGALTDKVYRDEFKLLSMLGDTSKLTSTGADEIPKFDVSEDNNNILSTTELASRRPKNAAIVNISHRTAICPNCSGILAHNLLPPDEQKRVRDALFGFAREYGQRQVEHLEVVLLLCSFRFPIMHFNFNVVTALF